MYSNDLVGLNRKYISNNIGLHLINKPFFPYKDHKFLMKATSGTVSHKLIAIQIVFLSFIIVIGRSKQIIIPTT